MVRRMHILEVKPVSEKEKAEIMESVKNLDEKNKQFVLGYAMGVASKATETKGQVTDDDHRGDESH